MWLRFITYQFYFTINLPLFFLKIHEMENLVKQPTSTIIYFSWYTSIDLAYFTYHIQFFIIFIAQIIYKVRKSSIRISFLILAIKHAISETHSMWYYIDMQMIWDLIFAYLSHCLSCFPLPSLHCLVLPHLGMCSR